MNTTTTAALSPRLAGIAAAVVACADAALSLPGNDNGGLAFRIADDEAYPCDDFLGVDVIDRRARPRARARGGHRFAVAHIPRARWPRGCGASAAPRRLALDEPPRAHAARVLARGGRGRRVGVKRLRARHPREKRMAAYQLC